MERPCKRSGKENGQDCSNALERINALERLENVHVSKLKAQLLLKINFTTDLFSNITLRSIVFKA
jgi:hypothetical protein